MGRHCRVARRWHRGAGALRPSLCISQSARRGCWTKRCASWKSSREGGSLDNSRQDYGSLGASKRHVCALANIADVRLSARGGFWNSRASQWTRRLMHRRRSSSRSPGPQRQPPRADTPPNEGALKQRIVRLVQGTRRCGHGQTNRKAEHRAQAAHPADNIWCRIACCDRGLRCLHRRIDVRDLRRARQAHGHAATQQR